MDAVSVIITGMIVVLLVALGLLLAKLDQVKKSVEDYKKDA